MKSTLSTLTICDWDPMDQPREKLIHLGTKQLSNTEILTILIGSGIKEKSAFDIASLILHTYESNLEAFKEIALEELLRFPGIGQAKAVNILAAMEWGKRVAIFQNLTNYIKQSDQAYNFLRPKLEDLKHEEFWLICLNTAKKIIHSECLFVGGLNAVLTDPKVIFKKALQFSSHSIIVAHNQPSGRAIPSEQDIKLTTRLESCGKLLDLHLLDHLIIGSKEYYSFSDEGKL